MLRPVSRFLATATVVLTASVQAASPPGSLRELQEAVSKAAGVDVVVAQDGVVRMSWSRDDVKVTVDGTPLKPAAGLGSWAAFKTSGDETVVMGDTVVFEDEITPAIDAALQSGLNVTALHNHFIFDEPPVYFMHIGGQGVASELASGVSAVWNSIREIRSVHPRPRRSFNGPRQPPAEDEPIEAARLEDILGAAPSKAADVVKFTFPHRVSAHGVELGGPMGVSTWAAFSGSAKAATVDGDFVMQEIEVQPTLEALRARDIHVVALHNHMMGENPRLYFLHYWGRGEARALAEALRYAMDAQAAARQAR